LDRWGRGREKLTEKSDIKRKRRRQNDRRRKEEAQGTRSKRSRGGRGHRGGESRKTLLTTQWGVAMGNRTKFPRGTAGGRAQGNPGGTARGDLTLRE